MEVPRGARGPRGFSPQGCGGRRTSAALRLLFFFCHSKLPFSPAPSPFFLLLLSHSLFTLPPFRVLLAGRQSNAFGNTVSSLGADGMERENVFAQINPLFIIRQFLFSASQSGLCARLCGTTVLLHSWWCEQERAVLHRVPASLFFAVCLSCHLLKPKLLEIYKWQEASIPRSAGF